MVFAQPEAASSFGNSNDFIPWRHQPEAGVIAECRSCPSLLTNYCFLKFPPDDLFSVMANAYFEDKQFTRVDFTKEPLEKGTYEGCTFVHCEFQGMNLSLISFIECTFDFCNLSNAQLVGTIFRDALFKNCKMLGLLFNDCDRFALSFRFENCLLNHSSFYELKIKNTVFKKCKMQETDFTETDCNAADFDGCDLLHAKFERTKLEKADFRTAVNYSIDPTINKVKKARFALPAIVGLLDKFEISIDAV